MTSPNWNIPLSAGLRQQLQVQGDAAGRYLELFRSIAARLDDGSLQVDAALRQQIGRYAYAFGRGPLQMVLRDLLVEIDAAFEAGIGKP